MNMSPIDQLTHDTLVEILNHAETAEHQTPSSSTSPCADGCLYRLLNKYFTDRQKLEMAADQAISHPEFATKGAALDSRPDGF